MRSQIRFFSAILSLIGASAVLAPASAHASKLGLMAGLQVPTTTGIDSRMMFGASYDLGFIPLVEFGPYVHYSSGSVDVLGVAVSRSALMYGLETGVTIPGLGLMVGAKAGAATLSSSVAGVSSSATKFSFGPKLGFDFGIAPSVSVGAEAAYMIVTDSDAIMNFPLFIKFSF